jgi:hypothetical protein
MGFRWSLSGLAVRQPNAALPARQVAQLPPQRLKHRKNQQRLTGPLENL